MAIFSCRPLYSHLQLVCTWYFGILQSRIPLTMHITANMCFYCGIYVMQMDFIPGCDFTDPHPVLPKGVFQYKGFDRPSWITKCVILKNDLGMDVAWSICHSVNADFVIDSDDMPLDNDRIAIQIVESLVEDEVPLEWMFSMKVWHIRRVFLNGTSLYDHDQQHISKQQLRPWIADLGGIFDSMNLAARGRMAPILQRRCLSCQCSQSILYLASFAARRIASSHFLVQRFTCSDRNSSMKVDSSSRATIFLTYTGRSTTT